MKNPEAALRSWTDSEVTDDRNSSAAGAGQAKRPTVCLPVNQR